MKSNSYFAGMNAAHKGFSAESPSIYNSIDFEKGWLSVDKSSRVLSDKGYSLAFVGSFHQCCEFVINSKREGLYIETK